LIGKGFYLFQTLSCQSILNRPDNWEKSFEMRLALMHEWIKECGIETNAIHNLEVAKDELAHYSKRTVDIEFDYPFGKKELYGLAYRTDFDLKNHGKASGKEILYTDPVTNEKYVPHVIEPSFGVDRTLLAVLLY
jgi:glycyl-tRNA synthetase